MYDVVTVGYGPTGMLAAILLVRAGHRVAVIERYKTLYNLPRVGIVHDDVLRMFQEIGCIDAIWPATRFLPVYELAKERPGAAVERSIASGDARMAGIHLHLSARL